ncbi:MAG: ATP-binding cassette domain-containing protein, partial [Myxococcota bacterium]|nr:ATP-binding cassette domain-containing protein [Myxococcota bacterium]
MSNFIVDESAGCRKMAFLDIQNIELNFSGIRALDGVSLEAEQGQLVAVIGPNGAGKTSLFNCISGIYRPQKGQINFAGENLLGQAPHCIAALGVARTFQNLALFDHLTVLENLLLGRHHIYKTSWWQDLFWLESAKKDEIVHREKVEEILEFLDLERYRKMPVGILPYGVLKRIELGRALCMEPKLLL